VQAGLRRVCALVTRKEILSALIMIFCANVMAGVVYPYFSLYAESLGAGLVLVGLLSSVGSVASMAASVPVGWWADAVPTRRVILFGMVLRTVAPLAMLVVSDPRLLAIARVISSVAVVATTMVGVGYVANRGASGRGASSRGMAIGVYTTMMGSGFALGSFLGGWMIPALGYASAFLMASAVALLGFLVSLWGLDRGAGRGADCGADCGESRRAKARSGGMRRLAGLISNPFLLGACVANFSHGVWFSSLMSYFPLYATSLSVPQVKVGMVLSLRILASALSRLPAGAASARVPNLWLVSGAMAVAAVSISAVGATQVVPLWTGLLFIEGLAYGAFLASGRGLVLGHVAKEDAGTALGVFSMAGGVGSIVGPSVLGMLAERYGLAVVFWGIGLVLALSVVAVWAAIYARDARPDGEVTRVRPNETV
jgi:MFS family permease